MAAGGVDGDDEIGEVGGRGEEAIALDGVPLPEGELGVVDVFGVDLLTDGTGEHVFLHGLDGLWGEEGVGVGGEVEGVEVAGFFEEAEIVFAAGGGDDEGVAVAV